MPEPELLGYKPTATEAGQGQLLNGADWHPPGGNGQLQQNGANGIPVKKKEFLSDPDIDTRPASTADPDKVNFKNGRVSPTDKSDKDDKDKDKDKEKKEPEKMVGFFEVFKFSTCVDKLLMIFGSIFALAHGAALPAMIIVFGDMTDLFVESGMFEQLMNDIRSYLPTLGYTYDQVYNNPLLLDNNRTAIQAQVNYTIDWNWLKVQDELLDQMKTFALYYIAIAGGVMVCGYVQVSFWAVASERQAHRIRDMFLRNVLRQEIGWFDTHETGELNTRLSDDINKIHEGIGDKMGSCLQWTSGFLTGFIIGFIYGWKLTLVILAISPLLAVTGFVMNKLVADMSSKESEAYAKAGAVAEEVFSSIRTVVSFGGQQKECQRYNSHLQNAKDVGIKKGYTNGFSVGLVYVVMFGAYALGFWYGAKLVREESDTYTIGKVLIIFFSVLIGAWSIGNVAPPLQSLASARGAAFVVFDIIKLVPEIDSYSEVGSKPDKVTGNIQFRNVKFTYPARKEVQVLKGVDLTVQPGQTVALVGSSGCGKSTCVQLMTRFYDPEGGTITLDGKNLKDLNVKWLREHIGIVSQEPILFAMSIKDNIKMGRNNVTDDEVIAATKMANAYNFIMDLPEKFDTLVGERGAQLSGGQKQRVAIARALVRDPKILLLDEATSALDTESESIVQEALDKARAGRTTLVIAHRLSTIKNADIIAGFKEGVIVEQGTHDQLMARSGVYNSLVTLQTKKVDVEEEELIKEYTEGIKDTDKKKLHRGMSTLSDGKSAALEKQESVTDKKKKKKGKKGEEEEKEKKPDVGFGRIIRYNAPEWPFILIGCIAACINGGVQPAFAVIFAELIGVFAEQDADKQEKEVLMYCLILLGIGVAGFIGFFLQGAMFGRSGENLTMRIRQNTFRAMIRQDISWYDDHKNATGALTTRLAVDASQVQGAAGARLGSLVQNIANMGTALVISFIYGWQLTLVIIAFLPAIAVGGALQMKILNGVAGQNKEALEEAGKVATEGVENIRTVASLTREDRIHDMYLESLRGPYIAALKKAHVAGFAFSFSQSVIFFAYAGAFFFGAYMIKEREMDFVDVFKVFSAIVFGAMALGQASAFAPDAAKAQASSEVIFPLLDTTPTIDAESEKGEKPHAETVTSTVTFRDCKFRYPTRPDVEVLQGLTLTVDPGQTLALVGTSGCGKSTTVALIERFYDVEAGSVLLDKYNVKDLNVPWLRSQIGIVSQEPILFDCSIRDNIAYGDNSRTPSMDEIIKAARNANIHEFISSLPDGYDTNVGDKGTQLSGGQKQRVAIARALLRNPRILLLDEATSALDTESEKIVQEALDKARAGRTCIVIAHRLSTIQNADKICVIRHGTVSEEGKHNDLMAKQGIYYKLNMAQKRQKDISWFDDHKNGTGALTTRLATDASQVQGAAGARLGSLVQNVANMGTAIVIAFIYGWQLTLVIFAFLPFIAIGGALEMKILQGVAGQNKEALEGAGKVANEGVENIRTVASLTKEDKIHQLYLDNLRPPYVAALRKAHIAGLAFSFSQSVIFFAYAAAFYFGAYMIKEREMDFTAVFKVFSAIVFGAMALGQASAFAPDAAKAQASSEVIFPLLDSTPVIDAESENGEKLNESTYTSKVTFTDCKFRYPTRPDIEVLQGLTLTVDPGQTLALVGTSGCGKSTTVALIERFYDVEAGSVQLDRYNVKDLNVPWLRSQIGIVSQEPILFDCSIRDNIAYGDNSRTPSMDEIIKAARNANIHEFISSLPDGYDTNVGDKGTQLSGGQKQRVAIARALLRNPRILLLDEATSALDTESEKIVQEALDKARAGRTCIVIAHRLSTIQNADKICVVRHGTVSEEGKHNDLMAKQGIYYKLNMAQKRQK